MKKLLSLVLSVTLILSMLSVLVYAENPTDYTEVDYSTEITIGTPLTGVFDYETYYTIGTEYWNGMPVGANVNLEAGKVYAISFTVSYDGDYVDELEPNVILLTGGTFAGSGSDFNGDALTKNVGKTDVANEMTVSLTFPCETTGNYRILGLNVFYDYDTNYEISIKELDVGNAYAFPQADFEWVTGEFNNDYGSVAVGPNGEIAIADYYGTYDSDADTDNYYLTVLNSDGTIKFQAPMADCSDAIPVFDENGNVYIGTYTGDLSTDIDGDGVEEDELISYVQSFDTNGNLRWTSEFIGDENDCIADDYDFWYHFYIYEDILIVKADRNILGIDISNGSVVWELNNIDCYTEVSDIGMTVADGKIYLSTFDYYVSNGLDSDVDTDSNPGYDYYENALLKIDALTGEVEDFIYDLDNCCGANDSQLVVVDGVLYFVCDGWLEIEADSTDAEPETLEYPLYAIDTTDMSVINVVETLMVDTDNYRIDYKNGYLYITDTYNTIYIYDAKTLDLLSSFSLSAVFNFEDEIGVYKIGSNLLFETDVAKIRILDLEEDALGNMNIIMEYGDYNYALLVLPGAEDGETTVTPIGDAYLKHIVATDDHVYFAECEGSVYSIKLDVETDTDTDSETDTDIITDTDSELDTDIISDSEVDTDVNIDTEVDTDITSDSDSDKEPEDYVMGDINLSGEIDIVDVVMARAHVVNIRTLTEDEIVRGDMNDDGIVDIIDIVMLRLEIIKTDAE